MRVLDVKKSPAEGCFMVLVRVEECDVQEAENLGRANRYLDEVMLEARNEVARRTCKPQKKLFSHAIRRRSFRGTYYAFRTSWRSGRTW